MQRSLALAVLCVACGGEEPPPGPVPFFPETVTTSYVEVRSCRFSVEHDGASIVIYASPESAAAYRDGRYPFTTGTVIVKVEHADSACSTLTGYAAMKKTGTGSTAADWQWQRVRPDRTVEATVSSEPCIRCHSGCTQGRDLTCADP